MLKMFISSHGRLASGFKSAADLLIGDLGKITVFDAYLDERSVEGVVEGFFKDVSEGDTVVLVADIFGGSVSNTLLPYTKRKDTYLVSGANLAVVLEILMLDDVTKEQVEEIIENCRSSMKLVTIDETEPAKDDSDEFF